MLDGAHGAYRTQMVCDEQAMLDGAHGAHPMHRLPNYGMAKPVYDGNAYTFSATVVGVFLRLYAHHVVDANAPGEQPKYFMTPTASHILDDQEGYSKAVRALVNLRVRAQKPSDQFIKAANTRAQ
ncbi:hypothetical protein F4680DRAFT_440879 [Xylaria scruposa]|nr:hypothetical protein F4680DRAFT_440879 [Xylaria scruposa]